MFTFSFLFFFALSIVVFHCQSVKTTSRLNCSQKLFKKIRSLRATLPSGDIISTHAVHSQIDCSFKCLETETCVAYNYRSTSSKYEVNCQLSNKTRQAKEISANGEWTFYQDVEAAVYGSQKLPGRSCADILAQRCDRLQNGIYWITLGLMSKPFPVFCDMDVITGWTLVFKLVAGVLERPATIWKTLSPSYEYSLEALNTNGKFLHPYKNRIVQNWSIFNPSEVKLVLYKQGEEKVILRFKAANSTNINWFSEANVLESPWEDLLNTTKNSFAIEGPCWSCGCRDFNINHDYDRCLNDIGWLSINECHVCSWEKRFAIGVKLIYSKIATHAKYNTYSEFDAADVLAVFLR